MRVLSYILIALGIYLLAAAGYDEYRGITGKPLAFGTRRRHNSVHLYRMRVSKVETPQLFRQFMTTHWMYATLIAGLGCVLFLADRNSEDGVA
jgi:hypothetical protein